MIEINWGRPLKFVVSKVGDIQEFSTIEQAQYWLRKRWPVADRERDQAIERIDAAMHCMTTVGTAREAFCLAAKTAGFTADVVAVETSAVPQY